MKNIYLGNTKLEVPAIAAGCMRMSNHSESEVREFIDCAMENGVNFFDHADIYGDGECEKIFGRVLAEDKTLRDKMIIQSKCGIVPGVMYDFSKEHIINSVDGILKRLGIEYLDILLLHRPDALMEPEEVASAFDELESAGKVRYFGVSNQKPMQIQLLKKYLKQDIVANQLQMSITNSNMISNGMEVNMFTEGSIDRDGSVLDFCRLNDITIQTWSPYQFGFFEGVFLDNDRYAELNNVLREIAQKYDVTPTAIVAAWTLRHPANMQLITGTMNKERFANICKGADIKISREEWYRIYLSAGHILP